MCLNPPRFALVLVLSVVASCPLASAEVDEQFARAAGHYSHERWQAACDELARLIKEHPDDARANQSRFFYGEALAQLNKFQDARAQFKELLRRDPKHRYARQALFRGGEAAYLAGDGANARSDFEAFRKSYPDDELNAYALPYLASLELQAGHWPAAKELFAAALNRFKDGPLSDESRLGLARAKYQLGELEDAERDYETIVAGSSTLTDQALVQLASVQNQLGQQVAALATLERLEKEFPESRWRDKGQLARGYTLYKLGRYEEAATAVTPLVEHAELGVEAGYWLGLARKGQKHWGEAATVLSAVAAKADKHALAAAIGFHAADARLEDGQHAEAGTGFERTLARFPESAWADDCLWGQVRAAGLQRHYADLVRLTEQFAKAYPDSPLRGQVDLACAQAAEAAYSADDIEAARALFALLARKDGEPGLRQRGFSGLAWCHFKNKKWRDAADAFGRVLTEFPADKPAAEAALMRGTALEHLEENEAALAMYRTVVDRFADSPQAAEALWRAARMHDTLKQPQAASESYAALIKSHPQFEHLDAAIYRLAVLVRPTDPDRASELFGRLRREFPNSQFTADATLRLAERAVTKDSQQEAKSLLAEVVAADTSVAVRQQALFLQARAAVEGRDWKAARQSLDELMENYPDSDLALSAAYWMAEVEYQQGQFEEAATRLAELAERTKEHPQSWSAAADLRRAQSHAQLKQWGQAREIARQLCERYPDFEQDYEANYLIGRSLAAEADFAAARESYAKALDSPRGAKTQTAAMAQWMIGESFFHQEDYQRALAEYLKVDDRYPFPRWQAAALLQAGKCYEALADRNHAIELYDRVLKEHAASEFAEEAARRRAAVASASRLKTKTK